MEADNFNEPSDYYWFYLLHLEESKYQYFITNKIYDFPGVVLEVRHSSHDIMKQLLCCFESYIDFNRYIARVYNSSRQIIIRIDVDELTTYLMSTFHAIM